MIETERLILRKVTLEDKDELFKLHSDPEVQKYTGEPIIKSLVQVEQAIKERNLQDYKLYGYGRLAVLTKVTKQFVGWAGLKYLPELDQIDLGYRFNEVHWGKGYATEASKAILDYGFNKLNLKTIIAITEPNNKASIKVMKKVGMKYEKHAPYEKGGNDAICYKIENGAYN